MTDAKMWQLWLASGEQVAVFGRKIIESTRAAPALHAASVLTNEQIFAVADAVNVPLDFPNEKLCEFARALLAASAK